jgi:hypothetical protein
MGAALPVARVVLCFSEPQAAGTIAQRTYTRAQSSGRFWVL